MSLMMMNTKLKLNHIVILCFPKSITAPRIPKLSGLKSLLHLTLQRQHFSRASKKREQFKTLGMQVAMLEMYNRLRTLKKHGRVT